MSTTVKTLHTAFWLLCYLNICIALNVFIDIIKKYDFDIPETNYFIVNAMLDIIIIIPTVVSIAIIFLVLLLGLFGCIYTIKDVWTTKEKS
jgi:uncharacterized membrane protein